MGEIVTISSADAEELVALAKKTFYNTFKGNYDDKDFEQFFNVNYTVEKFDNEINNPKSFHYFYQVNGKNVGYLHLNIDDAQTEDMGEAYLEVQRIYFDEAFQGGGRGSEFIKLAEQVARQHHKNKIWLGVWEHNPQALSFYKSHGFKVVGEHHFRTGEVVDTDLIMEKDL
ncbi:GNAT family N-acetyltransferase [Staphylococcus simiae]|uniref:Acetyltransferase n=1 Tax=Staphylococcus simiae CCM 7213 = CCUG 51256 TaxID=911238 RepID=G5JKQ9_9STAP|nr:GNAT family N-acetyltransferase [Staphylococcus simiae]EHJ07229.1 acetyltransferase [Staphylococcus simiae CCM 7213 = CCUG 51256]PNZ13346.1 N-acetyltransferase [Staphylococcus simiae]SNV80592.1 GNAT family acetyltransferase [Staphylococcus simiae]